MIIINVQYVNGTNTQIIIMVKPIDDTICAHVWILNDDYYIEKEPLCGNNIVKIFNVIESYIYDKLPIIEKVDVYVITSEGVKELGRH